MSQTLFLGPMYSGKSTLLLQQCERLTRGNKKCIVINFVGDNRYSTDNVIMTHSRRSWPAIKVSRLSDISDRTLENIDYIFIDEGQFFMDIETFCKKWLNNQKHITIAALDFTSEMEPFQNVLNLIAFSKKVKKLTAVCHKCESNHAETTSYIGHTSKTEKNKIGGEESYQPLCVLCRFDTSDDSN
jgi:thymidine kinase